MIDSAWIMRITDENLLKYQEVEMRMSFNNAYQSSKYYLAVMRRKFA
jgi:hypothetical protein